MHSFNEHHILPTGNDDNEQQKKFPRTIHTSAKPIAHVSTYVGVGNQKQFRLQLNRK